MRPIRIGLIGDRNLEVRAHVAIPRALDLAGHGLPRRLEPVWLPTITLTHGLDTKLASLSGLWSVPNTPYSSMEGALAAIRFARERSVPFLGTCGGFQHALIEFARDVLEMAAADHAESNPRAAVPYISALACPLTGASGMIRFTAGSRAARLYGRDRATEEYQCSFGFNPAYRSSLEGSDLKVTGVDDAGEVRIVELEKHPFFMATLFQPELSAFRSVPHPIIRAFVEAAFEQWHRTGAHPAD
jgi:CTP synthase (UTP-ammonia lyase)